jgi:hypothetical protein
MDHGKNLKFGCIFLGVLVGGFVYFLFYDLVGAAQSLLLAIGGFGFCVLLGFFMEKLYSVPDSLKNAGVIAMEKLAIHKEGLQGVGQVFCDVCVREKDVYIIAGELKFSLPYEKIYSAVFSQSFENIQTMKTDIKNKGKLGKVIVGGVLLGPTGAFLGAVSGSKSKAKSTIENKKVVDKSYLAINYLKDDELSTIVFESRQFSQFELLQNEINSRLPINKNVNANGEIEL